MAGPMKPMPRKNVKENFFKRELRDYRGSAPIDFMANKPDNARKRDCRAICKDIASGNINIQTEAGYFLNPALLDQLISFTYSKYVYFKKIADCVEYCYNEQWRALGAQAYDYETICIISINRKSQDAYRILYENFEGIKYSGNAAGHLEVMISTLVPGKYKDNI